MKRVEEKRQKRLRRKKHIRKRIVGTPERPRLSVFRSNRHLYVQVIDDTAGNTIFSVSSVSKDLRNLKNKAEDAARLGEIVGQKLKEKKIESVVFDRNGYLYHGLVKAIADGARKAGAQF